MKYFAVVAILLFAIQGCLGKPSGAVSEKNSEENFQILAKEILGNVFEKLEVYETFKDDPNKVATSSQGFLAAQVQTEQEANETELKNTQQSINK